MNARASSRLAALESLSRRVTNVLTIVGFAALLALAMAMVVDIVGRFVFKRPLHGVGDLAAVIMAVIVASSLPACFAESRNIGVDLLGQGLGTRAHRWLDVLGHVASLVFVIIFAWQLAKYASDIQKSGQTTWVLKLPIAPWWWVAATLAAFAVPVQAIVALRSLEIAAKGGVDASERISGGNDA